MTAILNANVGNKVRVYDYGSDVSTDCYAEGVVEAIHRGTEYKVYQIRVIKQVWYGREVSHSRRITPAIGDAVAEKYIQVLNW